MHICLGKCFAYFSDIFWVWLGFYLVMVVSVIPEISGLLVISA